MAEEEEEELTGDVVEVQRELAHDQQTVDDVEGHDEEQHRLAVQNLLAS